MKEFAVKYMDYDSINKENIINTKWFKNYNTALKFAEKNNSKVYNGYDLIAENQQKLRSGKITIL